MRVNIYAEEMTDRVELITKEVEGNKFTAVRFYLELPATVNGQQYQGAFIHRPGDDDSSAVTFWGKRDLRPLLLKALAVLDQHYGAARQAEPAPTPSPLQTPRSYYNGMIAGVIRFAHWKDGVQYVGSCGTTLKAAIEAIEAEASALGTAKVQMKPRVLGEPGEHLKKVTTEVEEGNGRD